VEIVLLTDDTNMLVTKNTLKHKIEKVMEMLQSWFPTNNIC